VDEHGQRDAQHDDAADDGNVLEVVREHGAQDLAAEHELEAQRKGLGQVELDVGLVGQILDEIADGADADDDDAHDLQQMDDDGDTAGKAGFEQMSDSFHRIVLPDLVYFRTHYTPENAVCKAFENGFDFRFRI